MSIEQKNYLLIEKSKTQELINFLSEIPFKYANPIISEFMNLPSLETYLKDKDVIQKENTIVQ